MMPLSQLRKRLESLSLGKNPLDILVICATLYFVDNCVLECGSLLPLFFFRQPFQTLQVQNNQKRPL